MLFLTSFGSVKAWGAEGHAIVATIAENYLTKDTQSIVSRILGDVSLASVSNWADSYKFSKGGSWSRIEHYLDIQDNPPKKCGLDERRDCSDQTCINYAIANHTSQLCSDDADLKEMGLKFLVHYFGDISQPLHNSNREKGGNGVHVNYGSAKKPNLHSIWDTNMVKDRMEDFNGQEEYVKMLIKEIDNGIYKQESSDWVSSLAVDAVTEFGNNAASIEYSKDSDIWDCSYVWPKYDANPDDDLSGDYLDGAKPIIDIQLAKGGIRLAHHLNNALSACSSSRRTAPLAKNTSSLCAQSSCNKPTKSQLSRRAHSR